MKWTKTKRGVESQTHVIAPATRTAGYQLWTLQDGRMWDAVGTFRTIAAAKTAAQS